MKGGPTASKGRSVALALSWDGTRVPKKNLSPKVIAFLKGRGGATMPGPSVLVRWLALDGISELRLCWVPELRGGKNTLVPPFQTIDGKRQNFSMVKVTPLGDSLGVIYRRVRT